MKRSITAAALAALCGLSPLRAEEEVFLSLTRSAEPRDRMPSSVSVLTAEEIKRSGAVTLADALKLLPSVDVQDTAVPGQFSNVRLRGVPTSNQVQVVVDDQPLGGVFLQDLDIGQLFMEGVERIEVVRGGASVLYGANTLGGVVHVITKKAAGDRPTSSVGYEARSFGTQVHRAEILAPGRTSGAHLAASTYRTEGFQGNSDGNGLSVTGGAGHTFASGARLSLEAARTDTEAGLPSGTLVPFHQWNGRRERAPANPLARLEQGATRARLKLVVPAGPAAVQVLLHGADQSYLLQDPLDLSTPRTEIDKNILGNDVRVSFPGRWTLGGSYERDEYRSKGAAKLHGTDWGLYLQKTLSLGTVDLSPAVRLDQHGAFGNTVNPRLTAVWRAGEALKFSGSAARSFRSPTFVDLYQDFPSYNFYGNPHLRPETAWSFDLGVEAAPSTGSRASLTGFYTRLRDRIAGTQFPYPQNNSYVNAPRAELGGVEAWLGGSLGRLSPSASYTYQRARQNSLSSSRYRPIAQTPRHLLNAQLTALLPRRWSATAGARYASRRYERHGEAGLKVPSAVLWNARLSKTVLAAELYLAGENLTNRPAADAVGFDPVGFSSILVPQPGRSFWGGMTIRFRD